VSAYVTKEQKSLIINRYGNLSAAVMQEIVPKLQANGHRNSIRNGQ